MIEAARTSERDLREAVWRAYRYALLLKKDASLKTLDMGLTHSSAAESLPALVLNELEREGDVTPALGAGQLVKYWPPALPEWTTKAVRDAVFASPQFPRLLFTLAIRETIASGVARGQIAYGLIGADGGQLRFDEVMRPEEVEISEDSFIVTANWALASPNGRLNSRLIAVP